MAALVEGRQYGLSAEEKNYFNKSLVFVKLTDSALHSIEEYVKNKGDTLSRPTIRFEANNGVICLPKKTSTQTFGFTLSNVEADGPKGSFECLRQTGYSSLESLGCMHMKMYIHATEDSYEKTRVKMAAVEQENKKFCTKEIKPSGAHLGRKVKVKRPGLSVSPVKPSSPPLSIPPKLQPKFPNSGSSLGSINSNSLKKPESLKFSRLTPRSKQPYGPELLRQPLRDRIIHILAIRPHKKPELLNRLMNDGVREKDKKGISVILGQIAVLKGNAYTLMSNLWNEVQESWKFCSPEESEIIKKQKQKFVSANAENEVPSLNHHPNNSPLQKRVAADVVPPVTEPQSKKQRISHYSRPDNTLKADPLDFNASDMCKIDIPKTSSTDYPSQKSPASFSQKNSMTNKEATSGLNQKSCTREENEKNIRNHLSGLNQRIEDKPSHYSYQRNFINFEPAKLQNSQPILPSPESNAQCHTDKSLSNGYSINSNYKPPSFMCAKVSSTTKTNGSCSASPHSNSDSRDSIDYNGSDDIQVLEPTGSPTEFNRLEYTKEYGAILSSEQRARYKADFNAQYEEYLHLHTKILDISKKFATLEEKLHTCKEGSDDFKKIRGKIYKEYRAHQKDNRYVVALNKFNFLHCKLSHIKRLVMDYDNAQCIRS